MVELYQFLSFQWTVSEGTLFLLWNRKGNGYFKAELLAHPSFLPRKVTMLVIQNTNKKMGCGGMCARRNRLSTSKTFCELYGTFCFAFLNTPYCGPVHKLLTHSTSYWESTQPAEPSWRRLVCNPEHPVQQPQQWLTNFLLLFTGIKGTNYNTRKKPLGHM